MSLKVKRALTILAGWLEAARVPFEAQMDGLVINGKKEVFCVKISDESVDGALCAADICAPIEKALPVFWGITERAGFGSPNILARGGGTGRVKYGDDPELVAMRHREFRQVANLPAHVYENADYQKIISWYCIRFYRSNQDLCHKIGYEIEDVKTYAWLYLTNFYGRWRHMDAPPADNYKMFCSYLQQRLFSDLKPLLIRKNKNIAIDNETAAIGQNIEYRNQWESDSAGHKEHRISVPVARTHEADLEDVLDGMDHDKFLGLLTDLGIKGDARARRFLTIHREECMECATRVECRSPILRSDAEEVVAF